MIAGAWPPRVKDLWRGKGRKEQAEGNKERDGGEE
tara:strand:- start:270 stop:374 length:105 start_codon:yes stop_codon:yes gene_type:complete